MSYLPDPISPPVLEMGYLPSRPRFLSPQSILYMCHLCVTGLRVCNHARAATRSRATRRRGTWDGSRHTAVEQLYGTLGSRESARISRDYGYMRAPIHTTHLQLARTCWGACRWSRLQPRPCLRPVQYGAKRGRSEEGRVTEELTATVAGQEGGRGHMATPGSICTHYRHCLGGYVAPCGSSRRWCLPDGKKGRARRRCCR